MGEQAIERQRAEEKPRARMRREGKHRERNERERDIKYEKAKAKINHDMTEMRGEGVDVKREGRDGGAQQLAGGEGGTAPPGAQSQCTSAGQMDQPAPPVPFSGQHTPHTHTHAAKTRQYMCNLDLQFRPLIEP